MKKFYFILFILNLSFFCTLHSNAQERDSLSLEISEITNCGELYGKHSKQYFDKLYEFVKNNSRKYDHFRDVASVILDNEPDFFNYYGVDSDEYQFLIIQLQGIFNLGKYVDSAYNTYRIQIAKTLLKLEKHINEISNYKTTTYEILADLYQLYIPNKRKSLKYAKKAYENSLLSNDVTSHFHVCGEYVSKLSYWGKDQQAFEILNLLYQKKELNENLLKHLMNISSFVINKNSSDNLILRYIDLFFKNNEMNINFIKPVLSEIATKQRFKLMLDIDSIYITKIPEEQRIEVYDLWAMYINFDYDLFRTNYNHIFLDHKEILKKSGFYDNYFINFKEANHFYKKAINLCRKIGREDLCIKKLSDGKYENYWEKLSFNYNKLNDFVHEKEAQLEALNLYEKYLGQQSEAWLKAAYCLRDIYYRCSDTDVLSLQENILSQVKNKYGEGTSKYNDEKIELMYSVRCKRFYDESIKIGCELLTNNNLNSFQKDKIYYMMGSNYSDLGDFSSSLSCYQEVLKYSENISDSMYVKFIIATLYKNKGENSKYLRFINEYKEYIDKSGSSLEKFLLYEYLALYAPNFYESMAYLNKSEKYIDDMAPINQVVTHFIQKFKFSNTRFEKKYYLDKAKSIFDTNCYGDLLLKGELYEKEGDFYFEAYDFKNSEICYNKALDCIKNVSNNEYQLLRLYSAMVRNYEATSRLEDACRLERNIINIITKYSAKNYPVYRGALFKLFSLYIESNNIEMADSVMEEYCLSVPDRKSKIFLYDINYMKGSLSLSKRNFREALIFFEKGIKYCSNDNDVLLIRIKLKKIYKEYKDWTNYSAIVTEDYNSFMKGLEEDYTQLTLDERKKQTFVFSNVFDNLMADINVSNDILNDAFEFSIFSNGLLFRSEKSFNKILAKDKSNYEKYIQLKDLYNKAVFKTEITIVDSLRKKINNFERKFTDNSKNKQRLIKLLTVSKDDILRSLPHDAIAIDFVRYKKDGEFYYGAFYISHSQLDPKFVSLFKESYITEKMIIDEKGDLCSSKLKKYFENIHNKGWYKYVWGPLKSAIDGYNEIYFTGTGLLNSIPIEYLKDEKRESVADKFKLHRVFSLTDIKRPITIGDKFAAFGVSDHNSPLIESDNDTRGLFTNLPEVTYELKNIESILNTKKNIKSIVYIDDNAREKQLKKMSGTDITTLHLSSHAFYLSEDMMIKASKDSKSDNYNAAIRFLKSGKTDCSAIVLRNGNITWHSDSISEGEDDILTSEEVENLDFPNLNLVVLSACQTGKGKNDIEGAWGLQRAFRIAGTKSLICTTRQVNSKYAEEFMTKLYSYLADGRNVYEAFTLTRKELSIKHRSNYANCISFILIE